ncbi:MAG: hypothetical protein AAGF11_45075 [Myxococcota bacterium]
MSRSSWRALAAVWLTVGTVGCALGPTESPHVTFWEADGTIEVGGLDAQVRDQAIRARGLEVTLVEEGSPYPHRPLAGAHAASDDALVFQPRFPLAPGHTYDVHLAAADLDAQVSIPMPEAEPVAITEVYPTAAVVPENLLKIHLHFATSIGDDQIPDRVHLYDEAGQEVEGVLFTPQHELWDPGRRRLTLLLDPGRVKTGLQVHEQNGRALRAGTTMTLVVDAGWRDLAGTVATEAMRRPLIVGPEDRTMESIEAWSLRPPRAGTRQPLRVRTPESLDQACLVAFVRVVDSTGRPIPGDITLSEREKTWSFVPSEPWQPTDYALQVDPRIEDLAGNNFLESFDHALGSNPVPVEPEPLILAFRPSSTTPTTVASRGPSTIDDVE